METSKAKDLYRVVNLSISLFIIVSNVVQFLLVAMSIGAVWVIDILMPITVVLFIGNLGFGAFLLFQMIFKRKKGYNITIAWIIGNQFLLIISFFILFASGMTLVNF